MDDIGLESARLWMSPTQSEQAREIQTRLGFLIVIRPSFTMVKTGGGIAYNKQEFETIVARGFGYVTHDRSITRRILIGLERV